MRQYIERIFEHRTLSEEEAYDVMTMMMTGEMSDEQVSAVLSILRYRGETVEEMTGFARAMRDKSIKIEHSKHPLIDTCGTGGDGTNTFNISTAVAILLSGAGVPVAKHGNRSVSSKTGSADVLEALGVPVQSTKEEAEGMLDALNLCFMFAPVYHSSMKHVAKARKSLGVKTIFNLLGPLTNPAGTKQQLIGVYDQRVARQMALTAKNLGVEKALFVTGSDGLDELTITGESMITELNEGKITTYTITPEDAGVRSGCLSDIQVSTKEDSAKIIYDVLRGLGNESARNIVLLNAGAALYTAGIAETIREGTDQARTYLNRGNGFTQLTRLNEPKRSAMA
ncbi:anthranilate phosphoribosyltransferase [Alteribacter keqinensis]|uniref:Anthranilate phosphoribosyltransferase n=1 Tax=Alteribacter keqinensis TaxID=2483800 RepID=A0A3M7TV87_9BACI|nr:anthranilate phosphoribosyltransferase [Alteribacter keqinensis]RNA69149.1 anthranilate phosphoribosyltransferase [Alteribacter keqinensis]